MKNNTIKNENDMEKMKEEIRIRLESDSWNFSIAHKVIETRNAKSERFISLWSMASLATAAMAFVIFMTSFYTAAVRNSAYNGAGSIYSYAYIKNDNNLDNDIIAARLELTINETYPMR